MFYQIRGQLLLNGAGFSVIDCGGVGYKLTVTTETQANIAKHLGTGEDVLLYTHLAVREDDIELFGFASTDELDTFKRLISVSGVGPKAAISILSSLTPYGLACAIADGDTKRISKAQGIGAKTAARIVLELRDKLDVSAIPSVGAGKSAPAAKTGGALSEALDALLVLGYNRNEAMQVLRSLPADVTELEEIIRLALAKLMK